MSSYAALNYWQSVKLMKYYKAVQSHRKKWGHILRSIGWLFEPPPAKIDFRLDIFNPQVTQAL